jgi:hypothetical protein
VAQRTKGGGSFPRALDERATDLVTKEL